MKAGILARKGGSMQIKADPNKFKRCSQFIWSGFFLGIRVKLLDTVNCANEVKKHPKHKSLKWEHQAGGHVRCLEQFIPLFIHSFNHHHRERWELCLGAGDFLSSVWSGFKDDKTKLKCLYSSQPTEENKSQIILCKWPFWTANESDHPFW